jgi:hypothetical protein
LATPLPPERKRPEGRPAPKLGEYRRLIDGWLLADRDAPRKQRQTARRIWERLSEEHGAQLSERAVRKWVAARRRELGEPRRRRWCRWCTIPQPRRRSIEASRW